MNPRESMLAAIKGGNVGVVGATYNFGPYGGAFSDSSYEPMLAAFEDSGIGVVSKASVSWGGSRNAVFSSERLVEGNVTTTILYTPMGALRSEHTNPGNQPGYTTKHYVETDLDFRKLRYLLRPTREPDITPVVRRFKEVGDKGVVYVNYEDPFYTVASRCSFEFLAMKCAEDGGVEDIKELVDHEFLRIREELGLMLEQTKEYELLFYTVGPEVATLLGPVLFRTFVTDYQTELVGMIREAGHLSSIHCHGPVRRVFHQLLEIGPHVIEPMEPEPQGDISLEGALDKADGRMCLMGHMQDQDLYTAKPGDVRKHVRSVVDVVGDVGFIMTPTATPFLRVAPKEFVDNYVEFIEAFNGSG